MLWALLSLSAAAQVAQAIAPSRGAQGVNFWRLNSLNGPDATQLATRALVVQDVNFLASNFSDFQVQWFEQPVDHFNNETGDTFMQRFWVNSRHYTPGSGGPVIVLDGGETSGENRLPFLDTGIVEILANATGGLGVVLEHRYYGETHPVKNLTTDSLRFLNNDQAAADSANFMANVKFQGIDEDLTSPNVAWIYYGGSYAGARAAHMRILYPDLVYGAIASSGVTHAAILDWEYYEVIRRAADPTCSNHIQNSIEIVDSILPHTLLKKPLKALFGLADLEHDEDFASVLESPLGAWQSKNWDPAVGSTTFDEFCTALSAPPIGKNDTAALAFGDPRRMVNVTADLSLDFSVLNYAKYIKNNVVSRCPNSSTVEDCFGTFNDTMYQQTGLDQGWRLWQFQVCTQWGYFMTAPPDAKHPRIISKSLTLDYESRICQVAYPPGERFTVPRLPNVTSVNVLGDFHIAADRLAIIDGEVDPWRPDTPHALAAPPREDTILRPFKLIPNAVHHYDEYGLANIADEPPEIRQIHEQEIEFVTAWLKDWKSPKNQTQ